MPTWVKDWFTAMIFMQAALNKRLFFRLPPTLFVLNEYKLELL